MGLVRRFSRPLTYFFGLCPVVLHGGALFLRRSVVGAYYRPSGQGSGFT